MSDFGAIFPLNATIGAAFLGMTAASLLYGITNVQTFLYYKRENEDGMTIRLLVFILWIFDGLHLALIVHAVYTYTILDSANFKALQEPLWCIAGHVMVSSISDTIIRGLFCFRIWKLSDRSWMITGPIAVASLVVFASGWAFSIWTYVIGNYFEHLSKLSDFLYLNFVSAVFADSLIAVFLCTLLKRHHTSTDFSSTNSIIKLLMLYSINTGVLTSACALACLLIYALLPGMNRVSFIAIYYMLPKLLLNSLLATLNARSSLRERRSNGMLPTLLGRQADVHLLRDDNSVDIQSLQSDASRLLQVKVETSTEMKSDLTPDIAHIRSDSPSP